MGLILLLIIGAIIGYVASRIMGRDEGILASTAIGVVGAFIGQALAHLVNQDQPFLQLTVGSVIAALIGACVLVGILNYVQRKRVRV